MNEKWCLLLLFCLLIVITGCEKKVMYMWSNFGDQIKASYHHFHGTETKNITLEEGEILYLEYSSKVQEGSLTITLLDPDGKEVAQLETNTTGTMQVEAASTGSYRLVIKGNKTKGSFDVTW